MSIKSVSTVTPMTCVAAFATCLLVGLAVPQAWAGVIDLPEATCTVENREDGCSVPGEVDDYVDFYIDLFDRSCRLHDRCYATEGVSRGSCDTKFFESMLDRCSDVYNGEIYEFWDWSTEVMCYEWATTFYVAVAAEGGSSYNGGQNWAANHCEGNDHWGAPKADDVDHEFQCPDDQFITGYFRINAGPFVQWHCSSVPGVSYSSTTSWQQDNDSDHKHTCADGKALVAAKKRQGQTKYSYKCATLNRGDDNGWEAAVNRRNGETFYCDDARDGSVMVGVDVDENGHVQFKCAKPQD